MKGKLPEKWKIIISTKTQRDFSLSVENKELENLLVDIIAKKESLQLILINRKCKMTPILPFDKMYNPVSLLKLMMQQFCSVYKVRIIIY